MTNDINEKRKICAEYMGWTVYKKRTFLIPFKTWYAKGNYETIFLSVLAYERDYSFQIPVWQKVIADAVNIETASQKEFNEWLNIRDSYINQICFGTPFDSFEILVQAIQFLNKIKNK